MTSGTVLDSIIEGVRADVAAREAALSLTEVKERATKAPKAKDALAALREPGIGVIDRVMGGWDERACGVLLRTYRERVWWNALSFSAATPGAEQAIVSASVQAGVDDPRTLVLDVDGPRLVRVSDDGQIAAEVDQRTGRPRATQLGGDEVGGQALADRPRVEVHPVGHGHSRAAAVDGDAGHARDADEGDVVP